MKILRHRFTNRCFNSTPLIAMRLAIFINLSTLKTSICMPTMRLSALVQKSPNMSTSSSLNLALQVQFRYPGILAEHLLISSYTNPLMPCRNLIDFDKNAQQRLLFIKQISRENVIKRSKFSRLNHQFF